MSCKYRRGASQFPQFRESLGYYSTFDDWLARLTLDVGAGRRPSALELML
jgi:hypothetical protein